ncbi:MAG: hypothetical protein IJ568_03050 [Bacilli bacterium]|nr:hypothetical protein [Bacilli bacterium]
MKKEFIRIVFLLTILAALTFIIYLIFISINSEKLVCKSSNGSITIMYDDETITGYTVKNINFNEEEAKEYIKKVGIKKYLEEFKLTFEYYYNGTCK